MRLIFLYLSLIFSSSSIAQAEIEFSKDSDTAFWYQIKNNYTSQFKLGMIEHDTAHYSFRLWNNGLVIQISSSLGTNSGEIIRFAEAYPSRKKKNSFVKRYPMSSSQVLWVRYLIDSFKIEQLPSDKDIRGWQSGLDGTEYFTEFKRNTLYSFKNYWTPTAQDSLKEAVTFQNFVLSLETILRLKANYQDFFDSIPFDSWSAPGSHMVTTRIRKW